MESIENTLLRKGVERWLLKCSLFCFYRKRQKKGLKKRFEQERNLGIKFETIWEIDVEIEFFMLR